MSHLSPTVFLHLEAKILERNDAKGLDMTFQLSVFSQGRCAEPRT
ncbi:hypothetical protein IC575_004883 [Cucumis melo]